MDEAVICLLEIYARETGLAETYVCRLLTGSGDTLSRMRGGMSMTGRRANRVIQAVSDHWPADLDWPADISRPAPRPKDEAA